MKSYGKIVVILLLLSIFWVYVVLNLLYAVFLNNEMSKLLLYNYSIQLKFIYLFGAVLIASYFWLIFVKKNNELN